MTFKFPTVKRNQRSHFNNKTLLTLGITSLLIGCGSDKSSDSGTTPEQPQLMPLPAKTITANVGNATLKALQESVLIQDTQGEESLVDIEAFKGVQFGHANRFAHSELTYLENTIDATEFGDACPQLKATAQSQSEDCLNLNLWRPEGTQSGDGLPVYLFIHGGDFEYGSGSAKLIHGDKIVAQGSVETNPFIFMTFNYRLGVLGSHWVKGENNSGNYGIGDQQTALEWVKQHIEAFGGDAQNVTLMGQGSGAMSVSILQQQAEKEGQANDYFQRSIMQSNPYGFEYRSYDVAKSQDDELDLVDASLEEVLLTQESLLSPTTRIKDWLLKSILPLVNEYSPISLGKADHTPMGTLMPFSPYLACEKTSLLGACSQNAAQPYQSDFIVPTVIGVNAKDSNTMSMLPTLTFLIPKILDLVLEQSPELQSDNATSQDWINAIQNWVQSDAASTDIDSLFASRDGEATMQLELEDLLAVLPKSAYEAVSQLYFGLENRNSTSELLSLTDFYPNDESELDNAMRNMGQFKMMMNDMLFSGPSRIKAKQSQQPVTFYQFDYKPSFNVWAYNTKGEERSVDISDALKTVSCISGACNGSELPFVFNKSFKLDGEEVSPSKKDKALMNKLSRIWFSDALFSDYQYSEATDSVMSIDNEGSIHLEIDWDNYFQQGVDPVLRNGRLNGLEDLNLIANYL
ncbi:carboxylesterase family protein [Vibrio coralliirubri]|uniref:carboxylesterase family protein n=1 Tax=Vibrio coralliirubri TaxID=1516159 RepID=UPI002FDF3B10